MNTKPTTQSNDEKSTQRAFSDDHSDFTAGSKLDYSSLLLLSVGDQALISGLGSAYT